MTASNAAASFDTASDSAENAPGTKAPGAFRTISEVADDLGVQQHVLRFWETKFSQVKPLKRGGGRRYYRPEDVALLHRIHHLLYSEGYTIKGVQKLLKGQTKSQILHAAPVTAATASRPAATPGAVAAQAQVSASGKSPLTAEQRRVLEKALKELNDMRDMLKDVA